LPHPVDMLNIDMHAASFKHSLLCGCVAMYVCIQFMYVYLSLRLDISETIGDSWLFPIGSQ